MSDEFEASWFQYQEQTDADGFIDLIKHQPDNNTKIQYIRGNHSHDRWDWTTTVIKQEMKISGKKNGKQKKDFIISEYQIQNEKIISLIQYIAVGGESPKWRSRWVKKCK